jgi:hypothetical protein
MAHLDVFKADAFSESSMIKEIDAIPYVPHQVGSAGIFTATPVRTTYVEVERRDNTLALVPISPRGANPHQNTKDMRNVRNFPISRIALEDFIYADEVQSIRAFGSESELSQVMQEVNLRQTRMSKSLEATWEHMMVGAIKGLFLDADGSTVLNYFTEFGVTPNTSVDYNLDSATPGLRATIAGIQRTIEDNAGGEPISGFHTFCGPTFFDSLVDNAEVKDAYERYDTQQKSRRYARRSFEFAGMVFEEYRGTVSGQQFVGDNEAITVPTGTSYFEMVFGPADYMSTVNTMGLPRYSRVFVDPRDRGVTVEAQSNPLAICKRPELIVTGTTT